MLKEKIITVLRIMFGNRPIEVTKQVNVVELPSSELAIGRTALVTGGSSGIGFAISKALLKAGASVVITGRNLEKIEKACEQLNSYASSSSLVLGVQLDHQNVASFNEKFHEILQKIGSRKIDILVNNAGTRESGYCDFGHTDEEQFDKVMNTNLKGSYFFSQMVAKYMKDNLIHGNILNIASSSSLRPANSAYILSKWGLRGMTLGMAKALIPYDIVVNGIAPGPTATPMLGLTGKNVHFPQNPSGRVVLPEEIANMAVILTSNIGRSVVGDIVYMTGGAGVITFDDAVYNFD